MAGTITTVVKAVFQSQGAEKVASDLQKVGQAGEEVGKKQTRLGNESTNTGRAFASQASGLGGLVAAYAGAAATTFALQQSFSALSAAARSEALVEGVKSLAQSLGQDGAKIIGSLKSISRGQLSITESAQNAGIALSAGLGGDQISELADIATRASKALGRDLTDSIQRLVRGVGKLEPELLDELGIFTRIEPAVERYAIKLGKAASSLTNFERRQAFANAVIEEGGNKYRNVDTTISDSSQNLNRLSANIQDLALKLGQVLTTILNPIVEFFNKDVAGLAGLIATLGALIFSKLAQVSREGVESVTKNIQKSSAAISGFFLKNTGDVGKFKISIEAAQQSIENLNKKTLTGPRALTTETKKNLAAIAAGPSPADIPAIRKSLEDQIQNQQESIAKREKQLTKLRGETVGDGLRGKALAEARKAQAEKIQDLDTKIEASKATVASLTNANQKLGESYREAGSAAQIAGKSVTALGNAFAFAGRFISGTINVLGKFAGYFALVDFISSLIAAIFGFENPLNSLISSISKFFENLFDNIKRTRQLKEAFANSFVKENDQVKELAGSTEIYAEALKNVRDVEKTRAQRVSNTIPQTLTPEQGRESQERVRVARASAEADFQQVRSQVSSQLSGVTDSILNALPTWLGGRSQGEIDAAAAADQAARATLETARRVRDAAIEAAIAQENANSRAITSQDFLAQTQRFYAIQIEETQKKLTEATDKNTKLRLLAEIRLYSEAAKEADAYLKSIIRNQGQVDQKILDNTDALLLALNTKLNVSATEAAQLVRKGITAANAEGIVTIKGVDVFGNQIAEYKSSLVELNKGNLDPLAKTAIEASISFDKLNSAIQSGAVTTDTLDGYIQNLRKNYSELEKGFTRITDPADLVSSQLFRQANAIQVAIDYYSRFREQLALTQLNLKDLKEAFASQIQTATTLARSGNVSRGGGIALTSESQRTNQLQFISKIIGETKTINDLERQKSEALAEQKKLLALISEESLEGGMATADTQKQFMKINEQIVLLNDKLSESNNAMKAITGEAISFARQMEELKNAEERRTLELKNQVDQLRIQNDLARLQQDLETDTLTRRLALEVNRKKEEIEDARRQAGIANIELRKARLEATITGLDSDKARLQVQKEFRDTVAETIKIQTGIRTGQEVRPLERQKTLMEEFGGMGGEGLQRELQFKIDTANLRQELANTITDLDKVLSDNAVEIAKKDTLIAQERKKIADQEINAINARGAAEKARIEAEFKFRSDERNNKEAELKRQAEIAIKQYDASILQIDAQNKVQELEFKLLEERAKQIKAQAEIFSKHIEGMTEVFAKDQAIRLVQLENPGLRESNRSDFDAKVKEATDEFTKGLQTSITIGTNYTINLSEQRNLLRQISDLQRQAAKETLGGISTRIGAERDFLKEIGQAEEKLQKARLDEVGARTNADLVRALANQKAAKEEIDNAKLRESTARQAQENAAKELEDKKTRLLEELRFAERLNLLRNNNFFQLLNDSILVLKKTVSDFAVVLFTDVINGVKTVKEAFRDFLFNLVIEIQKAAAKRLIADPLIDILERSLFKPLMQGAAGLFAPNTPNANKTYEELINNPELKASSVSAALVKTPGGPALRVVNVSGSGPEGEAVGTPGASTAAVGQAAAQTQTFADKLKDLGVNFKEVGTIAAGTFAAVLAATGNWKKAFLYTILTTFSTMLTQIALKQITASSSTGIFSIIGGGIKSIFAGPSAPVASAIGGPVRQMAAGGANGLRDRVPAMLEPGEYVVRRPAAKKLGFGKLNSINASGEIPLQLALDTVRKYGKGGDTELAHVNKKEQALLKRLGGSGTINRMTGLRQFADDASGGGGESGYGGDGYGDASSGGDTTTSAASQTSVDAQAEAAAAAAAAAASMAAENALSESRGVPGAIADTAAAEDTTSLFDTVANFAQSKIEQAINNPIATLIDAAFGFVSGPLGLVNTVSGLFGGPTVGSMATAAGRAVGEGISDIAARSEFGSRGLDPQVGSLVTAEEYGARASYFESIAKDPSIAGALSLQERAMELAMENRALAESLSKGLDPYSSMDPQTGTAALDSFPDLGVGGAGSSEPPLMEEIKKADSAEIEKKVIELSDYNSALMDLIRSGGYADPAFARFRMQQFASGGYASRRDSVPALLEPGEFVVRRPAAMAIGGEVLRQMNATGQVGPGNVTVNVQNLGTSQSVVGTPKVSVNGRDLIIDVVVKDIQNNGAIRKTLRGM